MTQTFVQHYQTLSQVQESPAESGVFLATPLRANTQSQQFFRGQARQPLLFRDALLWLAELVNARFYRPDLWRYLDPVVSCEPSQIRLECFSSCASVYGRIDLEADFFNGFALQSRGSTNVNFNPAFIQSLSRLRPDTRAVLEVGADFLSLESACGQAREEKVNLPERWLRGFLQSQALFRRATHWQTLPALAARQFLHQIKASDDRPLWLALRGKQLQALPIKPSGQTALPVAGLQRLSLLRPLIPHLQGLEIYTVAENGPSLWVAQLPQARATLALSSSVKHGFSGEGEALRSQSSSLPLAELDFLRQLLAGLESFSLEELALCAEISTETAQQLADTLAGEGLLGYDNHQSRYFYRPLPFVQARQKRSDNAHNLLQANQVSVETVSSFPAGFSAKGWVRGSQAEYRVELSIERQYLKTGQCNCAWVQSHQLQRGPCKHLLALRFAAEKQLETGEPGASELA